MSHARSLTELLLVAERYIAMKSCKEPRSTRQAVTSAIAVLIGCCIALGYSDYSEAKPSTRSIFDGRELSLQSPPEWSSPDISLLAEWYQDKGSGGFSENFSDEPLVNEDWELTPDESSSGSSYPYVGICTPWNC